MFADQLPHTAQMILGLDRESPIFTVYADDEEQLHVYYGFERLEVVSADRRYEREHGLQSDRPHR